MSSSDHPTTPEQGPAATDAASTGIQTSPPTPDSPPVPLPPPTPAGPSVEKFTQTRRYFDAAIVVLVLVFAFLVASSSVINSDFFRQLATGRLLAQGEYHFGVDPFTYTSEGVYWVNHSWLFALMVYVLYQIPLIGGAVVVVCKALLVTALAEVLLRISRRPGQSLWIGAVCTALAILALSPRLLLQSTCLSFLFLGLTLWLLHRPRQLRDFAVAAAGQSKDEGGEANERSVPRSWWLIPPLFVLWVNCDQWFFLGPLTVALYLSGELLQEWLPVGWEKRSEARRRDTSMLGLVLVAGLAACLLNPHHVRAFTLPPELGLSPAGDLIENDAQFRQLFLSPVRKLYYQSRLGLSVAGLTYWPLIMVGLVSFAFTFGQAPWWRTLVWLGFALLSLYSTRAIPFFAIVAGPIAALNWLDYAAHRLGRAPRVTPGWRRWSLGGRALTVLAVLVLLTATVPGWLQAQPHDYHRVGWGVQVNPSLEQAARQIHQWRDAGQLPADTHWFNMNPEVANYLAWFAPGERVFFDQSLPNYREAASDYLAVRQGLEHMIPDPNTSEENHVLVPSKDWRKVLRKRKVQYWIVDEHNSQKAAGVARLNLFGNPDEWHLCHLRGRIAIFGWLDPEVKKAGGSYSGPQLNLEGLAFGPEAEQAPPRGPQEATSGRDSWTVWLEAERPVSLDRETAQMHEMRFVAMRQPWFAYHNSRAWQWTVAASAFGAALPHGPLPNSLMTLSWSCTYKDLFSPETRQGPRRLSRTERDAMNVETLYAASQDAGPPESLYLGIRAARRALLVNPEDPQTYAILGRAYFQLASATRERFLYKALPQLYDIRRTQIVAAFQKCLRYQPNRPTTTVLEAHSVLADLFLRQGYLDLAARHRREQLRCMKELGPQTGEPVKAFEERLSKLSKQVDALDNELNKPGGRLDQYVTASANKPVLEKARKALENGLGETALNVLTSVGDTRELSGKDGRGVAPGIRLILELQLNMGRLEDAGSMLVPEAEMAGKPVSPQYLDFHVRLAAARGDYEEADRHLAEALDHAWKDPSGRDPSAEAAAQVGRWVRQALHTEAQLITRMPWLTRDVLKAESRRLRTQAIQVGLLMGQQRVEWYSQRGWLALEAGRCVEARRYFQEVLNQVVPEERWVPEIERLHALVIPQEVATMRQLQARQFMARAMSQRYLKWLDKSQR